MFIDLGSEPKSRTSFNYMNLWCDFHMKLG